MFPLRGSLPRQLHLYRSRREHRQARISGGERYAAVYNIDYNRCIFCGYCVEACPTDAITHGHGFELVSYQYPLPYYSKEQLCWLTVPTVLCLRPGFGEVLHLRRTATRDRSASCTRSDRTAWSSSSGGNRLRECTARTQQAAFRVFVRTLPRRRWPGWERRNFYGLLELQKSQHSCSGIIKSRIIRSG